LQVQIIAIKAKGHDFKIKMLTKEYQHTCKLTGLMLWESAQLMCSLLAENPSIVAGKRVLELAVARLASAQWLLQVPLSLL